ncbi:hypothetical protein JCM24511_01324 [Saitozyma sp. JCM 24511]|nr:hypothetical protein JCM24511_01324 [Saitozyma sp. JCM 24511]
MQSPTTSSQVRSHTSERRLETDRWKSSSHVFTWSARDPVARWADAAAMDARRSGEGVSGCEWGMKP